MRHYLNERGGFLMPGPEALMVLKLGAYLDRKNSMKGAKDGVDILGLLFYSDINMDRLRQIFEKYGFGDYGRELLSVLNTYKLRDLGFLKLNEKSFSGLKKKFAEEIKRTLL